MQRTPEPELMDEPTQAEAYANADFSTPDTAFVERWIREFGPPCGRIVDLGCGPGNIAFRLAEAGPCDVVGVDGAEAMLALARRHPNPTGRVRFHRANVPFDEHTVPDAPFDAAVSNSLLHHLHDPLALWTTLRRILRPGAPVLVADLRRPATPEAAKQLQIRYASDAPDVLRHDFLASLHAAFEPEEIAEQLASCGLGCLRVEPVGDRHLVVFGHLPIDTIP